MYTQFTDELVKIERGAAVGRPLRRRVISGI